MPRGVDPADEALIQGQLWTPRQLPTLVGWFDADDPLTVYGATTGGSLVTTQGGTVKRWEDKSGRGNHATQSDNAAPKLQITSGTLNNKRVLAFTRLVLTSTTMMLQIPSSADFDPTLLSVCCLIRSSQTGNNLGVIGRWQGVERSWALLHRDATNGRPLASVRNSTETASFAASSPAGTTVTDGNPRLIGMEAVSGGTLRLFVNGNESGSTAQSSERSGTSFITIGAYGDDNTGLTGDIAEVLLWRAVGAEDRQKVEGYLAWKWGVRNTLYPGHQYINRAPTLGD
jgi:hypothetical protein